MIVKDADPVLSQSVRAQAGARAERDMAFYLRRAFGDGRPDVLVFNDVRFERAGEVAQIDHLVVHRHGMFIIESKSVSGEIHIDRAGQFVRVWSRTKREGMHSPVRQAELQRDLLRKLLNDHRSTLRDRILLGMLQGSFTNCPIEIRVAISNQGIIRGNQYAPEVRKADLITEDISDRLRAHAKGASWLNTSDTSDGAYALNDGELARIRDFLLAQHRPRNSSPTSSLDDSPTTARFPLRDPHSDTGTLPRSPTPALPAPKPSPSPPVSRGADGAAHFSTPGSAAASLPTRAHACPRCRSQSLAMMRGSRGYFLRCLDCNGNIRLDLRVPGSARIGHLRCAGRTFILACPDTGREFVYFTNPIRPKE